MVNYQNLEEINIYNLFQEPNNQYNKKFTVYQITNKVNGMIYVGVHCTDNINDGYYGSGTNIQKAIELEGKENFIKEILFEFDNKEDMLLKEAEIVNLEFILRKDTYNIQLGGGVYTSVDYTVVKDKNDNIFQVHVLDSRFISRELVGIANGLVSVKDINGNTKQVNINDPKYLSSELQHINKNKVVIIDKKGNKKSVDINDPKYLSGEYVGHTKGFLPVKNNKGETKLMHINDPKYISGEYYSINKNKTAVKDKEGNIFQIDKNDQRIKTGELKHFNKNKVTVKDKNGNTFSIKNNDFRYLSGELQHISKGKTVVKDKEGNILQVDKNDERIKTGELEYLNKGKFLAKDKEGNFYSIYKNDPRYLSGELITSKHSEETKKKMKELCPDKSGKNNPCYGKRIMCNINLKTQKYIKLEEIEQYTNKGWLSGTLKTNLKHL